jgi:hypothetical protein
MESVIQSSFLTIMWRGLLMFLHKVTHHHSRLQFLIPQVHNKQSDASFTRMSIHFHLYMKPQIYRTKNHTNFDIWYLDSRKYALLSCMASLAMLPNLREDSSETVNPTPKK